MMTFCNEDMLLLSGSNLGPNQAYIFWKVNFEPRLNTARLKTSLPGLFALQTDVCTPAEVILSFIHSFIFLFSIIIKQFNTKIINIKKIKKRKKQQTSDVKTRIRKSESESTKQQKAWPQHLNQIN